jgi:hypothetical protein
VRSEKAVKNFYRVFHCIYWVFELFSQKSEKVKNIMYYRLRKKDKYKYGEKGFV